MTIQEKLASLQSDEAFVQLIKSEVDRLSSSNAEQDQVSAALTNLFLQEANKKGVTLTREELESFKSSQEDAELASVSGGGHAACSIGTASVGLACGIGALLTAGVVAAASAFVGGGISAGSAVA
jgi:hypothetical protein